MDSVEAVAELAFRCVVPDKDDQPDAREVLAELMRIQTMLPDLPHRQGFVRKHVWAQEAKK